MKQVVQSVAVLLTGLITFGCSDTQTSPRASQVPNYSLESGHRQSFSIEGDVVNAATGQVIHLTGGGSFDPSTASNTLGDQTSGHGNGSFDCVGDFSTGVFAGCSQGTHWNSVQLLQSSPFKCGGVPNEQGKTATTGDGVIVVLADFFQPGDGSAPTFRRNVFIADRDLAPDDVPGIQNVWIQGFGCGNAVVHFGN